MSAKPRNFRDTLCPYCNRWVAKYANGTRYLHMRNTYRVVDGIIQTQEKCPGSNNIEKRTMNRE